jgi:hypothetical protein
LQERVSRGIQLPPENALPELVAGEIEELFRRDALRAFVERKLKTGTARKAIPVVCCFVSLAY